MPSIRPTFSESWYRVANLRAKLRPSTQISRQYYRGERWYVVRDPAGNQFHRLSDAAYQFVALLDGTRTVAEAWDLVGGQLADEAPTQPEVIQILSQLHSANLVEADVTADAAVLLRRHKQRKQRETKQRLMSLLFPKIPLWDPDRFLQRWLPVIRPLLSSWGTILWLLVVGGAIALLMPRWEDLRAGAMNAIAPGNWAWLWVVFVGIKLIHELGHGFACRRFGGEVHEVGIMFLVFVPVPYVDASSSWMFPSKWARIFVGAAGMIAELFVAAILAVVWLYTSSDSLINQLAYNGMLIASVSTLLFNANPLLRYDGYYILSDLLEIPNLRQKSNEYTLGLVKRHIFKVKSPQPLPPPMQRVWSVIYAVAAAIYRVFIGIMIALIVIYTVPVLGILMAIGVIITFMFLPLFKLMKYLAIEPELHRKRPRAIAFCGAVAAAVAIAIGVLPFQVHVYGVGVLEPLQREVLHARVPGFVSEIHARDGQQLDAGDIILVCQNDQLILRIQQLEAALRGMNARLRHAAVVDQAERMIIEDQIQALTEQYEDALRQRNDLTIRAPIAGRLIAPDLKDMQGQYLPRGEQVAIVATMDQLLIRTTVDQRDYQLAAENRDLYPEIRLASAVGMTLLGHDPQVINAAQNTLPHPSLGHAGGGNIQIDPRDPQGMRARIPQHEIRVKLANPELAIMAGQRAHVRWEIEKKPLIWNWNRRFWQLVNAHSSDKWL
jgi:putative peptide zinc metalloprotease protein